MISTGDDVFVADAAPNPVSQKDQAREEHQRAEERINILHLSLPALYCRARRPGEQGVNTDLGGFRQSAQRLSGSAAQRQPRQLDKHLGRRAEELRALRLFGGEP